MNIIAHILVAGLLFALHAGISSATTSGIPLHALAVIVVLCVWFEKPNAIAYRIIPAALCVDILQPTRVPVTLLAVLATWGVATLVQRRWLTNHSIASLAGIAVVSLAVQLCTTWLGIGLSAAFGASSIPFFASWSWAEVSNRLFVEICATLLLGVLWRFFQRSLRKTFLYGAR